MKKLSAILLVAIMLLSFAACGKTEANTNTDVQLTAGDNTAIIEVGEGETIFGFTVVDADGNTKYYNVSTDKKTVGEALLDAGLISGENGPYGLYVKTVSGMTYDYEKDGKYWAFYANDELSATGVDMTDITEGTAYAFKAE
ncbi:MAG: DUF4430 domain-containing protein [Clostridia bacterium]|nr:DUF4430 domain-containing protein [Clostridia bacterium]